MTTSPSSRAVRDTSRAGDEASPRALPFPFDVAAQAGPLIAGDRSPGDDGVEGGAKVGACYRLVAARPAVVHLTAIDEPPSVREGIEEKEIWGARSRVGASHILRLVVAVRKRESQFDRLRLETLGPIVRIFDRVVRADRDDTGAPLVVAADARKLLLDVLDVRTMPADEHDEQRL